LKIKKDNINKLKKEYTILENIYKTLLKERNKILIMSDIDTEKEAFFEKLKNLKENYFKEKELNKNIEAKVKEQHNLIRSIEDKCKKLKEKIEYLKNKPNEDRSQPTEKIINEIEEKIFSTETTTKFEDKHYKQEIILQNEMIDDLNGKLYDLTKKIKEKDRDSLLNEIREKEKIKRQDQVKTKRSDKVNENLITSNNTPTKNNSNSKRLLPIEKTNIKNRSLSAHQDPRLIMLKNKENKKIKKNLIPLNKCTTGYNITNISVIQKYK